MQINGKSNCMKVDHKITDKNIGSSPLSTKPQLSILFCDHTIIKADVQIKS